jgi:genome maintenance exonuclease 1
MNPKLFIQHDIAQIDQINSDTGRLYETPTGRRYPSATTILGIESEADIQAWRDKVGHAEADKISRKAANRGTKIHEACENYMQGLVHPWGMFDANPKEMFGYLKPVLEDIDEIHAMETRLYSDTLQAAGTVDLIARYKGKMTILDWKTSGRVKSRDDIHSYFKQCAFYAQAFWERTGIVIPDITIAMAVDDFGLLLFEEKVREWVPEFIKTREKFRELKGY